DYYCYSTDSGDNHGLF
nr:immunoglobulin light chain junction region [Macaca mulatta]